MRYFTLFIAVFVMCAVSFASRADQSGLVLEVSQDHIDVTVGFAGTSIKLFGDRRDAAADVVVMVEGPRRDFTIWKKSRVLGAWVNLEYVSFNDAPSYYQYALSIKDRDDALKQIMFDNEIGFQGMFDATNMKASSRVDDVSIFKDAMLAKKQRDFVYFPEATEIEFLNDHFFRLHFEIPPSAPTGEYKVHSFLIKDGHLAEHDIDHFKVEQVGLNAAISSFAREHSLFYALSCIILALFSGWLGSSLRVKP